MKFACWWRPAIRTRSVAHVRTRSGPEVKRNWGPRMAHKVARDDGQIEESRDGQVSAIHVSPERDAPAHAGAGLQRLDVAPEAPLRGLPGAPRRRVRTPGAALDQWPRAARRGDHGSHRNNRQRLTSNLERTEDARLLTLVGPAGVAKTRLALAAAARLTARERVDRFPDGVVLVDLTPGRNPALVPGAIALGLMEVGGQPVLDRLVQVLDERSQLVVLDNLEQVLPAAALPLGELLASCPLALLVTSRVPLRLRREQTVRVEPLPIPDSTAPLLPLEALLAVPSVALFARNATCTERYKTCWRGADSASATK
jgi:hypothetical protein